jgi:hypothetical protein
MDVATLLIVAVLVAVIVVALVVFLGLRRGRERRSEQQRERTREEFGSEYERAARERGSEEEAERELRERRYRVERRVEPLSDESRDRYVERWEEAERVFLDNPGASLETADRVVFDLLIERNIVADMAQSNEETEKGLGVLYPEVADDYREARRLRARVVGGYAEDRDAGSGDPGEATEEMRQALRGYRSVYERLVRD